MVAGTTLISTIRWLRADEVPADSYWVHDEHFPDPITPLYGDFGPGNLSDDTDLTELASPIPTKQRIVVDGYFYTGALSQVAPPTAETIAAFEERLSSRQDLEIVRRWFEVVRPAMVERHARLCQTRPADLDSRTLATHIRELAADARAAHRATALNVRAVSLITKPLEQFCATRLGLSAVQYQELLAGSSTTTGGPVAAMEDLASRVQGSTQLRTALRSDEPWLNADIRALLQPYLDAFGHRLLQPDFIQPTLAEQPVALIQLLREAVERLEAGGGGASASVRQRSMLRSVELRDRLSTDAERESFDRLLAEARSVHGIREDGQAFLAAVRGFLRYALLESGRRLAGGGVLEAPEHVWYLHRPELEEALAGRPADDLAQRAEQRLVEHGRQRRRTPPGSFGAPPAAIDWPPMSAAARMALAALGAWTVTVRETPPAQAGLRGMAASRGTYTGPARIVLGPEGFERVQPGDVLVCKISSPAWTIIFGRIGGIVTEIGSVLSHPAIAAREFGIPAVLSVAEATTRLHDGQLVTVDGDTGMVHIVAPLEEVARD